MNEAAATPTSKLRANCGKAGATKPNPMAIVNADPTSTQISTGSRCRVSPTSTDSLTATRPAPIVARSPHYTTEP
ncbi:hypothetical protein GCM10027262_25530 [Nocardia tengchongensis]